MSTDFRHSVYRSSIWIATISMFATSAPAKRLAILPAPTDLGSSVDTYLDNNPPQSFRKFAEAVIPVNATVPNTVVTHAEPAKFCDQNVSQATVTTWPAPASNKMGHEGTYRVTQQSHTYVIAKIEATGCDLTELGLKRGHRGFWVVEPDEYLLLRSHFIDVGGISDPPTSKFQEVDLTRGVRWTFSACPQKHTTSAMHTDLAAMQVRRTVCTFHDDQGLLTFSGPMAQFVQRAKARLTSQLAIGDDPFFWIICADGCCYANRE